MVCPHSATKVLCQYDAARLLQCEDCSIVFADKPVGAPHEENLYQNYYKGDTGGRFRFGMEWLVRMFRLFRAFKIVTICPKGKSILDVGSGRGFMLYYLKHWFGFGRAVGTQISPNAVEFSRTKLGLEIRDKDLLEIQFDQRFDVITMWHVLEHVDRPQEYVERIHELLVPGGRFIVEVPNFDSWTRAATGQYWLGLDLDYHVTFFSPMALGNLLAKCGFEIQQVHTFSLEYSTFISAQSLLGRLTHSDQYVFKWLQNPRMEARIFVQLALFGLLLPICFLINLLLYFTRKGEVLLIVARKKTAG